jgi:predicted metal-binding membrane protein
MTNTRRSDRAFFGISALAFGASAAVTVIWCGSMSAMPGMEMPGGWTMSMAWMRMPGQSWADAVATFLGMWTVMMVAMMLPVLAPMLARYRAALHTPGTQTTLVAAGYFAVWTLFGVLAYLIGITLATASMRMPGLSNVAPMVAGVVVFLAGALQFTRWKSRLLACCRDASGCRAGRTVEPAWRHGLRLGLNCVCCCLGHTAVLLVLGVMDLLAMGVVTIAIAAERLAPAGIRVARGVGTITMLAGLVVVGREFLGF